MAQLDQGFEVNQAIVIDLVVVQLQFFQPEKPWQVGQTGAGAGGLGEIQLLERR